VTKKAVAELAAAFPHALLTPQREAGANGDP
jgi:hypothetical protein